VSCRRARHTISCAYRHSDWAALAIQCDDQIRRSRDRLPTDRCRGDRIHSDGRRRAGDGLHAQHARGAAQARRRRDGRTRRCAWRLHGDDNALSSEWLEEDFSDAGLRRRARWAGTYVAQRSCK
jgi:hypothetical protein